MKHDALVVGGGVAGLATALALGRTGLGIQILEQASAFGEVGAGLQLGPNAVRVLAHWGLTNELNACAAFPDALQVRDARGGERLGRLSLGAQARARYGYSYATLHRADLHALLLQAVRQLPRVRLALDARVAGYTESADGVRVSEEDETVFDAHALVGADGLWSRVRSQLLGAQPVRASGHLAYRGMVRGADLSVALRAPLVTAWLGPRLHVVHYPVRQGDWFNVVVVVHGVLGQGHGGAVGGDPQSWSHEAHAEDLRRTLGAAHVDLLQMVEAVPHWTLWPLNDRPPMTGPQHHARGRVALLGDAAHPLRPYLAQGAAMALEDAWTLGCLVESHPSGTEVDWPELFQRFAHTRWARNARVQRRSQRNGAIFHASGLVRWGRNAAMATLGESLLDLPWLYAGPPQP
jgi:salicylate hydroxylase